jgi:hypothetical protein
MSYVSKDDFRANIVDIKTLNINDGKIDAAELQILLENVADSTAWVDEKITMPALNYDCSIGSWQEKTLTTNSTLTITNPQSGVYYRLTKIGAYTLALPTGNYSTSGATVPVGRYIIMFSYDGTDYDFNFSESLAV